MDTTLKCYLIDGRSLPVDERDLLFKKISGFSFMRGSDSTPVGFLEVFWNSDKDIRSFMNIPDSCIIKEIHSNENLI